MVGQRIVLALATVGILYVAWPLIIPIALGAVFASLFFPGLEWLERKGLKPTVAAGILTSGIAVGVLTPTALLSFLGARAGIEQIQELRLSVRSGQFSLVESLMAIGPIRRVIEWTTAHYPVKTQTLIQLLGDLSREVGLRVVDTVGGWVTQLPSAAMASVVAVLSMYFFMADGRRLLLFVRRFSVFTPTQTDQLVHGLGLLCRGVVLASLVSGVAQSLLFSIVGLATLIPNVALIGFLVFWCSFIPLVGATPVTFYVAFHQIFEGNTASGIALGAAAVVATLIDNIIRPWVMKGQGNLHPLLGFVAALGGLQSLGLSGIFLGPILAGFFVLTLQAILAKGGKPSAGSPSMPI